VDGYKVNPIRASFVQSGVDLVVKDSDIGSDGVVEAPL